MTWLNWVLLGVLANALSPILQKKLFMSKPDNLGPLMIGTINLFLSTLVILVYLLLSGGLSFNLAGKEWNVLLTMILYTAGNYIAYRALMHITASENVMIGTSGVVWTVLSASIFLGEKSSWINVLGIVLIITGVVILNYQAKKIHFNKYHLQLLVSSVFYGLAFTNAVYVIQTSDSISFGFLTFALATVGLLVFAIPESKPKAVINYLANKKVLFDLTFFSILSAFGLLTAYLAIKAGGTASQISPIYQLAVMLTVFISVIFLKERSLLLRKVLATIVMVAGAILVNIA